MGAGSGKSRRVHTELVEIVPQAEITLRASRSSGPGGQHANVTASRVVAEIEIASSQTLSEEQKELLTQRLGPVVTAVAQDTRSQLRNREVASERLQAKLAAGLKTKKKRKPTKVSAAAKARRIEEKRQRGERKQERRAPHDDY